MRSVRSAPILVVGASKGVRPNMVGCVKVRVAVPALFRDSSSESLIGLGFKNLRDLPNVITHLCRRNLLISAPQGVENTTVSIDRVCRPKV